MTSLYGLLNYIDTKRKAGGKIEDQDIVLVGREVRYVHMLILAHATLALTGVQKSPPVE